jgi:LysR family transcriptional regulator, hydrogen peroxide-inducible genes activator
MQCEHPLIDDTANDHSSKFALSTLWAASLATAVQCVTGGLGVTLIPQSAVPVEAARSRLELAYFAPPRPGRRIGLVFRSSSGREGPYRHLAELIGELVGADQQVRPAR